MRRRPVVLFSSMLLLVPITAFVTGASAQDGAGIGVAMPYVDVDGVTHGSVTIGELTDPYTSFDPSGPPAEGLRFVDMVATFESASDQKFDVQPYYLILRDTNGYLWAPGYVQRPADALYADLQGQTMSPNNKISGAVAYTLPVDAVVDEVLYLPANDRIMVLVDQVAGPDPAAGTPLSYTAADGSVLGVSATLSDQAPEIDPNAQPPAGTRFVSLVATYENMGGRPIYADPYALQLRDSNGRLYWSTYLPRLADLTLANLEAQTLSPGDHVSGVVGYAVPVDATIASVDFVPTYDRRLVVADLGGGVASDGNGTTEPAATAVPASAAPGESAGTGQ